MKAKTTEKPPQKARKAARPPRGEAKAAGAGRGASAGEDATPSRNGAPEVTPWAVRHREEDAQRRALIEAALARKRATTPERPKPTAEEVIREMRAERGRLPVPEPSKAPTSKGLELCQRIHQWFNGKDGNGKKRTFPQLEHWQRFADARCDPAHLKDPKGARAHLAIQWVNAELKHSQDSLKIEAELGMLKASMMDALKAAQAIDDLHPFQWGTIRSREIVELLRIANAWTDQGLKLQFPSPPKRGRREKLSTAVAKELERRGEKERSTIVEAIKALGLEGDEFTTVTLSKTLNKQRERERKPSKKRRRQRKPGK